MKIYHPIEPKHRRVTQAFWENFQWEWKTMYWKWGHIPSWRYHLWIDYSSKENKWGSVKPLPIRAWIDWELVLKKTSTKGNEATITWNGWLCNYLHLHSFEWENRYVTAWEIIGYTGNTGTYTTAAHLHMGVSRTYANGSRIKDWLDLWWIDFYNLLTDDLYEVRVATFRKDINWIKIEHKPQPSKKTRNWWYNPYTRTITLYPHFFTHSLTHQEWILWHEWTHSVYFDLPWNNILKNKQNTSIAKLWDDISKFDTKLVKRINRLAKTNYRENEYITEYAKKAPSEDLSEMIEFYIENKWVYSFKWWLHIKMLFALWIVKKYWDFKEL